VKFVDNATKMKKYYEKKKAQDPTWNSRRQKEYRAKHPQAFAYMMGKYYYRKLNDEFRLRFLQEVVWVSEEMFLKQMKRKKK
jgi:hypothetical protein